MEELSDKDFDQIFKSRIKEGYLEYEEESWLKMEKKLRAKDRFVFFRNASIILLFLSFGIGIYMISSEKSRKEATRTVKKMEKTKKTDLAQPAVLEKNDPILLAKTPKNTDSSVANEKVAQLNKKNGSVMLKPEILAAAEFPNAIQAKAINNSTVVAQRTAQDSSAATIQNQVATQSDLIGQQKDAGSLLDEVNKGKNSTKRGIILSVLLGPDFNSTENTIGGKGGVAMGVAVSIPILKKLSVQTGLNYGLKKYAAQGYDYTFNNPNTVNIISGIDASCKVLEIPLGFSYQLTENQKRSINLNAGLSSYLMLTENYRFIYTQASGRKDRLLEEKNANQHYLSVVDLSATYHIKLKNKNVALGIQPYVKLPLAGIGAGKVPLKSSGVSLKLNYEFSKKK